MRNNQLKSASGQILKACCSILGSLFLLSCLMAQPGFGAMPSSPQQKAVASVAGSSVTMDYHRVDAIGFPVIVSYVSVNNDSGFNIGDLTEDNFKVFEDGTRELPIQVEELTDSVGVSVILVIDRSTSMKDKPIADAKNAASTFIQLMNAQDEAAIVSFASHVTTDHPYSSDKASLLAAISNIVAKGGTAIFDALIHSAGLVRSNYGRQAIILLTDGQDKDSQNTMQDAIRTLVPLGVPVYTIGLNLGKGSDEENVLQTIASATGGRYYRSPTSDDLEAIYRAISRLLHHFYRITYTTHNPLRDGTLRHVLIEASVNNSTASDTASYRAPLDRVTFAAVTGDIPVPGREFSIEIVIPPASNPIYKMERLQFTLSYDAKYLQVKQPYARSLLGGGLFGGDNDHTIKYSVDPQKGELQIILTKNLTSGPVDGTGKIARLVFQTSAQLPDRYPLRFKFKNLQALNVDGKDIPSETRDLTVNAYGNVTVALNAGSKLSPGKPFVLQVVIPANAKYLPGMQSMQFTLKYDPSYLRINEPYDQALQMGKLFGSATQNQVNFEIKPSQGTITMSLMKKQGFPQVEGRGELAQVVFSAAWNMPDSTEQYFEFLDLVATDSSGWVIPTSTQNLTVYSYGLSVWPGDTNGNGQVELTDVNVLGLYWAIRGPGRPAEPDPVAWKPQFSERYPIKLAAYADADGSGEISERDLIPIGLNWGKTTSQATTARVARQAVAKSATGLSSPRVEITRINGQEQYLMRLLFDTRKAELQGITFRFYYPTAGVRVVDLQPGTVWPGEPLFFSNHQPDKHLWAVGIMMPAGAEIPHQGSELVTLRLQLDQETRKDELAIRNLALVTPDGQVHEVAVESENHPESATPESFELFPAFPNPFNPETTIRYRLNQPGQVHIRIFNPNGQLVFKKEVRHAQSGRYSFTWNGENAAGRQQATGVYFLQIEANLQQGHVWRKQQKLTLMK